MESRNARSAATGQIQQGATVTPEENGMPELKGNVLHFTRLSPDPTASLLCWASQPL